MSLKRTKDIDLLRPPFQSGAKWLLRRVEDENLPFKVFETMRSKARQESLLKKGYSKASFGQSAHNFGFAMDLVLDTEAVKTREREWKGKLYPDAWDNKTPECVDAWVALGLLCRNMGLEWGGDWFKGGTVTAKKSDGITVSLGWDLPHVELKNWRADLND